MKKTVLFRAPLLTQSGYGVHARQVFRWLLQRQNIDLRVQALPWGDTPWILDGTAYDGLIEEAFRRTSPPQEQVDVSIQLQLPNEWDPKLGRFNVGITAAIETDRCNPEWIDACNRMSLIIVPSEHAKRSLTANGVVPAVYVAVVPEAFCDAVATPPTTPLADFSTKFNFLIFGQLTGNNPDTDRKNTFYTVKWLCETFKDDPDVGLVIKTNAGRNTKIDRQLVINLFKQLTAEVRKGSNPRVHLVHGEMTDNEVAGLYHHPQIKALVALTRGEGFGLPILEAAAAGLPVITTGWSGHMDFMRAGKFTEVAYSLTPIPQARIDNKLFVPGAQWASTSESDFKKRVQKFRNSPYVPRDWAADLAKKLRQTHSFEAIAKAYDNVLGERL